MIHLDELDAYWTPRLHRKKLELLYGKCAYCGQPGYTIDHIKPLSKGGDNSPENLVLACGKCNLAKGNKSLSEFCDTNGCNPDSVLSQRLLEDSV